MNNRDIEDGMGFGGLVPSPEEKILTDLYQKGFAAGQKEMKQRAEQLQRDNTTFRDLAVRLAELCRALKNDGTGEDVSEIWSVADELLQAAGAKP